KPFARTRGEHAQARVAVPGRAVADAAEAPAGQDDVLFEDALGAAADAEIDIADDPGTGPVRSVFAALAHRRDAGDELRLAQGAQFWRPLGAGHLAAFEKDRRADVVPAVQVFDQVIQQVVFAGRFPQVMVWVDDRPPGLERRFLGRGKPVLADRQVASGG